jgi:hypothetical protein
MLGVEGTIKLVVHRMIGRTLTTLLVQLSSGVRTEDVRHRGLSIASPRAEIRRRHGLPPSGMRALA